MKGKRSLRQWISIQCVKNPSRVILTGIILFNILFLIFSACVISALAPTSLAQRGFWASVFYTVTMILDAGCIQFVVDDVGTAGVAAIIACLAIVLVGMITFTGCVIGYITNVISNFVANAESGTQKLHISDHIVILNWNSRASEIVNDLVYCEHPKKVVVLVPENKEAVEAEIENRLADTLARERLLFQQATQNMGFWARRRYAKRNKARNKLTVIVRQGDTFSTKQLMDISLDRAKSVIILTPDVQNDACRFAMTERMEERQKGSANTVKTLVLVAEITAAESSADNQKIIVEVEDDWTLGLVQKVIEHKERLGKCNIVPIPVNRILGQILSQFSIMPELNLVYSELFSNRGAEFYSIAAAQDEGDDIPGYLADHFHAIPLTNMETKTGRECFFMADKEDDLEHKVCWVDPGMTVQCNPDYWLPRRNVLILGHNSKVASLMSGFDAFRAEWNPAADGRDILNIFVVDDTKSLEKMDYYRAYPYVHQVIEADIYDRGAIYAAINSFIDDQDGDTGILILSDDNVPSEDLDAKALTYLIYVQDVLTQRRRANGGKDTERVDVVIEILNPKNYDVVHSYSVNNVVISNRYISKMITQVGDKQPLFTFYSDILTYDAEDADTYTSMELYIKRVGDFLTEVPPHCCAASLIRAVYAAAHTTGQDNTALVLGCVTAEGEMTIFAGDQTQIMLDLTADDKLIVFSNH